MMAVRGVSNQRNGFGRNVTDPDPASPDPAPACAAAPSRNGAIAGDDQGAEKRANSCAQQAAERAVNSGPRSVVDARLLPQGGGSARLPARQPKRTFAKGSVCAEAEAARRRDRTTTNFMLPQFLVAPATFVIA